MSGSEDREAYLKAGIHAVQSTPLVSRSEQLLGMVSTHWREPHEMSQTELRALDILARLAADIIERSRADEKLQEALNELRFVTENMSSGVARCSADLRYLWVNPSYSIWLGIPPSEIAGRPILDVIGRQSFDEIGLHIEKVLGGQPVEFECEINYRGTNKFMHKRYMPTRGENKEVDGWISVVTDFTSLRDAQAESFAKEKLQSLGVLARGIAHDFNNLLGGITAQAELGLAQLADGSNPEEEFHAIRDVALRGSEIVRELMTYAGKETRVLALVDTSRVIRETLPLLKVAVSKHAALEIDLNKDVPAVLTSDAQIRQILLNLVTNASQAIGEQNGTIRLTTSRITIDEVAATKQCLAEGDYLQLAVSDTGSGMSQETQDKIFEPFFTTKATGRGIGLSVVQGIVRGLGGAISVTSVPHQGTTFQILLPGSAVVAAIREDLATRNQDDRLPSIEGAVLVVDDEKPLRQAVGKMLDRMGFDLLEAADGVSAAELLRAHPGKIGVMLLDMTLPGLSIDEIIAIAVESHPNIRVILTSAFGEEMVRRMATAPQIRGFVRKPFLFEDLLKTFYLNPSSAAGD
jgi:signal transduction histidine kinase